MSLYNELTLSESRKIIDEGWWATGITDAIKNCFVKVIIVRSISGYRSNGTSNMEVSVNLSALYHMLLESECITNNFNDEEYDNDEIWQRDDCYKSGAFYVFQKFMDDQWS